MPAMPAFTTQRNVSPAQRSAPGGTMPASATPTGQLATQRTPAAARKSPQKTEVKAKAT